MTRNFPGNGQKAQGMTDISARVEALSLEQASFKVKLDNVVSVLDATGKKMDLLMNHIGAGQRVNWGIFAAFSGLIFTFIGMVGTAGWFTITQNVQLSLAPQAATATMLSELQKEEHEQIVHLLEENQARIRKEAEIDENVVENRANLRAEERIRNLMYSLDHPNLRYFPDIVGNEQFKGAEHPK